MTSLAVMVRDIDDGVPGIRTLTLARADGGALPSFTPGSHIVVECDVPGGMANAYSLTGDGFSPTAYVISVLECPAGSGGSSWIHHGLAVGDSIVIRPPRSAFAPVLIARRHLLIAAGIGVTPMISHLRSAQRWGRDVRLRYLHRDGRGAYADEINALTDDAQIFTDRTAFLAAVTPELGDQPLGTHLYVCGPTTFMADITATAAEFGWPPSRIHLERFSIDTFDPGRPFEVLLRSGVSFVVDSGVSLLEALHTHGVEVPSLCRQGVCGECRIPVAAGRILHRDLYLSDAEKAAGDAMMSCVSRADGDRLELSL
jgi:dimethylamine monooxygenase subunit B